jgi:CheY-like chemotaxis protein
MTHALIIDDNAVISRAVENRLVPLGFNSFDHTWTEKQALDAATARHPDLVVVGDSIAGGSPVRAAQRVAEQFGAPILLVAAGRCEVRRKIPAGAVLEGPFSLSDIDVAVAIARAPERPSPPAVS